MDLLKTWRRLEVTQNHVWFLAVHRKPSWQRMLRNRPIYIFHPNHFFITAASYAVSFKHGDHYRAVVPLAHERLMEHNTINNETTTDDAQPVEVLTTSTTSDQLTSNPVLANITVVNNGSSETSCDYTEPMKMFSPHSVRPFPKAGERKTTKGGRKKRRTAILTDTPEKQALENEQKLKKTKDPKPNLVRKRLSLKRRPQKTKVKRSSKTARQDCFCLVCGEPYSNSKSGEQWIQCFGCEDWSHVQCVPSGPGYTCHNCDIDESDFIH